MKVTEQKKKGSTIKSKEEVVSLLPTTDYDPDLLIGQVELVVPEGLTKDLKKELRNLDGISRQEMKALIDNYYQVQNRRIALQGQIRALQQEADDVNTTSYCKVLDWQLQSQIIQEKGIKDALEAICKSDEVGQWLLSIKGIGPVFAAGMIAYFDISRCNAATQFISYAGQNDNNRPWLGNEGSKKLIEEVVGDSKEITDEHLQILSLRSGWKYDYLKSNSTKIRNGKETISKTELVKAMSKVPYNKDLKKMIFLIEESFVKVANRGSLYGQLIQQRKAIECVLNEQGHYADQAGKILATKNIGKDTDAYKAYSQGKLPKAHIQRRACRWAAKIFLVHVFEEMYRVYHDGEAPEPFYVFSHQGHKDYISPEVPFTR